MPQYTPTPMKVEMGYTGLTLTSVSQLLVPSINFGPLLAKFSAEIGVSELFGKKTLRVNLFLTWQLPQLGWVSWSLFILMFLGSILALWYPNIWYMSFTHLRLSWVYWPLSIFMFLASIRPSGGRIFDPTLDFRIWRKKPLWAKCIWHLAFSLMETSL